MDAAMLVAGYGPVFLEYIARTLSMRRAEFIERVLREKILALEDGREPTANEVRQFARCMMFHDGAREYKWRGTTILKVAPVEFTGAAPRPD